MRYSEIEYVPEDQDPSLTVETERLVAQVIDNTGLLSPSYEPPAGPEIFWNQSHVCTPYSHLLGYHGIRCFHDKEERRNLVSPFFSWLNIQSVRVQGIPNPPVDERAWSGNMRGWPMRLERRGAGAAVICDPLEPTCYTYTVEFQPGAPDAIDFSIRFEFTRYPDEAPINIGAKWPFYMSVYDDVQLRYPQGTAEDWEWVAIGERPPFILGEPVGYQMEGQSAHAAEQAFPLAYGRIGDRALAVMFSDPTVHLYMVNCGGHHFASACQNPAWDFSWELTDYPLNQPVGLDGRIIYTDFRGGDDLVARYEEWLGAREAEGAE